MPRLKPAPGYITAADAISMLDISDATLSQYVKRGWLKRYGPLERKHKFYKLSEVEAIIAARNTFDEYQEKLPAFFEPATPGDIPTIVNIDERTFNADHQWEEPRELYIQWVGETYSRWLGKNPEAFSVLRDTAGKVVGYSIFLPLKKAIIDRFVRDEMSMSDILPDDVDLFEPGKPLHIYVIALCVDPVYKSKEVKHGYGKRLIQGLFNFMLDLARRGIEIETITARSYTPDGKRLLREMGMTHLRSPVPEKELFSIRVADSGFWALVRYSDLLDEWKREHQKGGTDTSITAH
ncbi:MAG: hypothetical protein WCD86_16750 [Ktedonobacteraceae bacterium]